MKNMKGVLKTLLWVVLVVGGILIIGRFTFYEPAVAMDNTMAPTIWKGDKVLIMTKGRLDYGHIAYCKHPMFEGQYVMGRIVAIPGDTVEIANSQLEVNNDTEPEERGEVFTYIDRESATQAMEAKFRHAQVKLGGRLAKLMYPDRKTKINRNKRIKINKTRISRNKISKNKRTKISRTRTNRNKRIRTNRTRISRNRKTKINRIKNSRINSRQPVSSSRSRA